MTNTNTTDTESAWSDDGLLGIEQGYQIGCKIVEMADRLKIDSVLPGMQATWVFELDDSSFKVTVERNQEDTPND